MTLPILLGIMLLTILFGIVTIKNGEFSFYLICIFHIESLRILDMRPSI